MFWRHESLGLPVADGVDEIALGLIVDAYSRTELAKIMAVGNDAVRSRYGLALHADRSRNTAAVDAMLAPPRRRHVGTSGTGIDRLIRRLRDELAQQPLARTDAILVTQREFESAKPAPPTTRSRGPPGCGRERP